jgi:hypothetical protein
MELVDESAGTGDLLIDGQVVSSVRYRITIYQQTLGPGGPPVPGLRRVEGAIHFDGGRRPDMAGGALSLRLADGRRLGIALTDEEGRFESCRHGFQSGCGCC